MTDPSFDPALDPQPGDRDGERVWDARRGWVFDPVGPPRSLWLQALARGWTPAARNPIDFVARLAELWDYSGRHCLAASGREHRALLAMAGLEFRLSDVKWDKLEAYQRRALVVAARQMVELGRSCAWVFGEGG